MSVSRVAFSRLGSMRRMPAFSYGGSNFKFGESFARNASCRFLSEVSGITGHTSFAQSREYYELDNETLVELSLEGNVDASEERLIREIMTVDNIEWDEAKKIFLKIEAANADGMNFSTLPYKASVAGVVLIGFATFPLCFDLPLALWFNDRFVTTDVAEPKDLETWLEVGSWTWNWMEPPLGQLSFFLLCLQFSRAQMEKIGFKPYTQFLKNRRAKKLSDRFSNYRGDIVEDYSVNKGLY